MSTRKVLIEKSKGELFYSTHGYNSTYVTYYLKMKDTKKGAKFIEIGKTTTETLNKAESFVKPLFDFKIGKTFYGLKRNEDLFSYKGKCISPCRVNQLKENTGFCG